jgi:3-methyladenine DNA glycosylase Tag
METGTNLMEIDMTASNIATLVDDAAVLNNEIKLLTAKLDAIKAQFKQAGVGEYEGHLATVTISQNKDTEGFDYKKAFEHVSEHISSQLLTATKKKFATVKAGAKVMNIDLKLAVAA